MKGYIEIYPGCFVLPQTAADMRKESAKSERIAALRSAYLDASYYASFAATVEESYRLSGEASKLFDELVALGVDPNTLPPAPTRHLSLYL